jgi:hypothetical protein
MKMHFKSAISVTVMGIALPLAYSSQAGGTIVVTAPSVVVSPPAVMAPVPDYYVWDGSEYVGVVGDQYYYLGPGNVWFVMDPPRMHRFQGWERSHGDWRAHATRNTRYRDGDRDRDRTQPMRSSPPPSTRSAGPPPQTRNSDRSPQTRSSGPAPQTRNSSPPANSNQGSDRHDRDQNDSHNRPPQ